jgi:xanthine/CO dehydrogenase XdhC/CoxF family maturation factor
MAALLGWTVLVADGRAHHATRERFPAAEKVIALGSAQHPTQNLDVLSSDAVVIMTHSYEQDRSLLAATLARPTRYLGLLGARHRTSILLSEAADLLGLPLADCCARLHAPIGLNLGGDGPEAVALAVLAQIQAVTHGQAGEQRRLTPSDIAEWIAHGPASATLRAECRA